MGHAVLEHVGMPKQLFKTLVEIRPGPRWVSGTRRLFQGDPQEGLNQPFDYCRAAMSRLLPLVQRQATQPCNWGGIVQLLAAVIAHLQPQLSQCLVNTFVNKLLFNDEYIPSRF